MPDLDDYPVVTENAESFFNQRQVLDYRPEREDCLQGLLTYGKEPAKAEGMPKGPSNPARIEWIASAGSSGNWKADIR